MSDQIDDSWFVRLKDVRAEIEEHLLPAIVSLIKAAIEKERVFIKGYIDGRMSGLKEREDDIIDIDKLAKKISEMDMPIKFLMKKQEEQEKRDKEQNKKKGEIK